MTVKLAINANHTFSSERSVTTLIFILQSEVITTHILSMYQYLGMGIAMWHKEMYVARCTDRSCT